MDTLNKIARIFSGIFSPLLTGTYGMLLIFTLSYLRYTPFRTQAIIMAVTFISTCILPILLICLLYKLGQVKDPGLNNRKERTIPYLFTAVCFLGLAIYMSLIHAPMWMSMLMAGGTLALLIVTAVNSRWKISGHATGMGALSGIIFFMMSSTVSPFHLEWIFVATIFLSGIVATSRLILNRHTLSQVAAGYANGMLCVVLPAWFLGGINLSF